MSLDLIANNVSTFVKDRPARSPAYDPYLQLRRDFDEYSPAMAYKPTPVKDDNGEVKTTKDDS